MLTRDFQSVSLNLMMMLSLLMLLKALCLLGACTVVRCNDLITEGICWWHSLLLLCLRERLWSIAMSKSVRLFVCNDISRTDRDAVLDEDSGGPKEPCIRWGCSSPNGKYARQVQIVFWKFLGAGDAAYRLWSGWWDCTVWAKSYILVFIYVCLYRGNVAAV